MNYNDDKTTNNIFHDNNDICPICLDKLTTCVKLSCRHSFHSICIDKWYHGELINNKKCPICRQSIDYLYNKQNNIGNRNKQHIIYGNLICENLIVNEINCIILFIGLYTIRTIYLYSTALNINIINNILNICRIDQINTIFWYIHYLISIALLIFEQKKQFNNQNPHYSHYSLQNTHSNHIDNEQSVLYSTHS